MGNKRMIIEAKLIIDDICNPCDSEAIKFIEEILNEAFGKEERKEHPRVRLILMDIKHVR